MFRSDPRRAWAAGRWALGAALALSLAGAAARAETADRPSDVHDADALAEFRDCRVAVFYHLDGAEAREATVPRSLASTLLEQIHFVMYASVDRMPPGSLEETGRTIAFTERFMLDFARAIPENAARFRDLRSREATLLDCVRIVWDATGREVDALLKIRRRVVETALGGASETEERVADE